MGVTKLGEPGARLQCPRRGRFYVCEEKPVQFVGCCNINPCATKDGNCPQGDLESTAFELDAYPLLPQQGCVDDEDDKTQWYTCIKPVPQFMGCCRVNPCAMQGCPVDQLRAARLSGKKENADVFLKLSLPTATSRPSTSTAAAVSPSQASAVTVSAAPTGGAGGGADNPQGAGAGTPKGTIAGTAVGSAIGGILVLLLLLWLKRVMKRKRERRERANPSYRVVQQPFQHTYPFLPESLGPLASVADRTLSPGSQMDVSGAASGQVTPLSADAGHSHYIPCVAVELPATVPANLASLPKTEVAEKAPKVVDDGVEMQPAELADTSKPQEEESNSDKMKEQ